MDIIRAILGSPEFTVFVLTAFAAITTTIVGWVAVEFRKRISKQLSATDLALLRSIATVAVQYAEQKFKEQDGPAKLAAAIAAANTMLVAYGLNVKIEQLVAIIEAAVFAETINTEIPAVALEVAADPGTIININPGPPDA